jgi:hypothetical protein
MLTDMTTATGSVVTSDAPLAVANDTRFRARLRFDISNRAKSTRFFGGSTGNRKLG